MNLIDLFKKHYNNFIIYQIEDLPEKIKKRLSKRDSTGETLGTRIKIENEVKQGRKIADRIFVNNKELETTVNDIKNAIQQDFAP